MKKILMLTAAALAALMLLPLTAFAAKDGGALPFSDVKSGDWYYDGVKSVYESNLMKGTTATEFDPEGTLTRGMCATVLYRAAKEPAVKAASTFSDVDAGAYYADAVAWAQSEKIVMGRSATAFDPDANVNRAEFSTMMYRFLEAGDLELPATRDGEPADADDIPEYAAEAVDALYDAEVVNGRENGEFDPDADITRAEAASVLDRVFERVTVRWESFYRKYNETWDYNAWITFDQDSEGGFYKDVELSDLSIGYVPEGYVLYEDTFSYEEFPGHRLFILYDPEMNPDAPGRIGPSSITIYIREGDKEVKYSDEMLSGTEEITINGMAAMLFDYVHEIKDGSDLNGRMLEVGDLAFGDKNFTVRIHWLAFEDEGTLRDEAIKIAESLTVIPAE